MLEHTHLYIDQYLIVVTFHRDVLQVGYSPLSLLYALGNICFHNQYTTMIDGTPGLSVTTRRIRN